MPRIRFRDIKNRFDNRRKGLSRLVLGSPIEDPLEVFGTSSYNALEGLAVLPSNRLAPSEDRSNEGTAFDTIVVESSDGTLHHSGEFTVAFEKWNSLRLGDAGNSEKDDPNDANDIPVSSLVMKIQKTDGIGEAWFRLYDAEEAVQGHDQTMTQSSWENDLKPFLKGGANPVVFCCLRQSIRNGEETIILQYARAFIWKWKVTDRVTISDIDGTITKSNARGVLGTILTDQYEKACHDGICHFLSKLAGSQILDIEATSSNSSPPTNRIVYLTSRPIHLANKTRGFLSGLTQHNESITHGLPQGPLLGFGGNLAKVLSMEVLSKTAQAFKAGELDKHIAGPFQRARQCDQSNPTESIFVAAFGNNLNDVQAYHKIGVDLDRIFVIDKNQSNESTNEEEDGFPPHSWYSNLMSTVFENGYSDDKLNELLGI